MLHVIIDLMVQHEKNFIAIFTATFSRCTTPISPFHGSQGVSLRGRDENPSLRYAQTKGSRSPPHFPAAVFQVETFFRARDTSSAHSIAARR